MTQPSLSSTAADRERRFWAFHKAHPEVYDYLVSQTADLYRRGFRHYGMRALWERARWHFQVEREMGEEFKLNDHYPPFYARLIMAERPEFAGFYETRERAA